jgi:hypothetical protein
MADAQTGLQEGRQGVTKPSAIRQIYTLLFYSIIKEYSTAVRLHSSSGLYHAFCWIAASASPNAPMSMPVSLNTAAAVRVKRSALSGTREIKCGRGLPPAKETLFAAIAGWSNVGLCLHAAKSVRARVKFNVGSKSGNAKQRERNDGNQGESRVVKTQQLTILNNFSCCFRRDVA